jgi:hypothetical protein
MELVHQRGCFDCGIAVVATLAQVPYEAVLDRLITGLTASIVLSELVVWRALEDITQEFWSLDELRKPWPQVGPYPFADVPTVVLIQRADESRHYIAVCGGWIYDPMLAMPVSPIDYRDRASFVVTVFKGRSSSYSGRG